jgi:hypothetical protein
MDQLSAAPIVEQIPQLVVGTIGDGKPLVLGSLYCSDQSSDIPILLPRKGSDDATACIGLVGPDSRIYTTCRYAPENTSSNFSDVPETLGSP